MNIPINLEKGKDGRWIIRFNNSTYGKPQSGCPRHNFYALLAGLHDPTENAKALYGNYAHLAWQHWALGKPTEECIQLAVDKMLGVEVGSDWRGPSHLSAMLTKWFKENEKRPIVADVLNGDHFNFAVNFRAAIGCPLVEWQWEFPIYEDSFAVVMLQGTIDLIHLVEGKVRVRDYKTTADKDPETKLEELLTSTQFLTYALAVEKLLGVEDATYEISGVFLRKDGKNIFQKSRVLSFENEEGRRRLEQHEKNLKDFACNLVTTLWYAEDGKTLPHEDYRFCSSGWGCPYRGITNAIDEHKELFIATEFEKKVFNAHTNKEN